MIRIARFISATQLSLIIVMTSLAGSVAAQTQLFEVEKSDATKLFQVQDDAGLVAKGAFDAGAIPASGAGVRFMWYPRKGAFRAGVVGSTQWDDASIGQWSVAFGENTTASGTHSVAMNGGTTASGDRSVALGGGTLASGNFATAMGRTSTASGQSSIAAGESAVASGNFSVAMGFGAQATAERAFAAGDNTTAAGTGSVALGSFVAAGNGSFIFGDRSTSDVQSTTANQFLVRAYGGIGFNSAPNIGCDLNPGSGAWACTSSRLAKDGFEDVDGEAVLTKLAGIRIQSWHYIGTTALHVGPTAEDFRAAFGLGETSTKIGTVDAEGIALRAVQALEKRTAALQAENAELLRRLEALEAERTATAK